MLNLLKDVFASLQRHNVRYLVIGGIAAAPYGVPRATFDLDILIEPTPDNAKNLLDAFLDANLGTAELTVPKDLLAQEITISKARVRNGVQTFTPGIKFSEAWENHENMDYQGQQFFVVSKTDLIASKKAAGRSVDLEDVRLLELGNEE